MPRGGKRNRPFSKSYVMIIAYTAAHLGSCSTTIQFLSMAIVNVINVSCSSGLLEHGWQAFNFTSSTTFVLEASTRP